MGKEMPCQRCSWNARFLYESGYFDFVEGDRRAREASSVEYYHCDRCQHDQYKLNFG